MRQGNDAGTQYRSAIYTYGDAQAKAARASKETYEKALKAKGFGPITTEIRPAPRVLLRRGLSPAVPRRRIPSGYCGLGGTGVSCPAGVALSS